MGRYENGTGKKTVGHWKLKLWALFLTIENVMINSIILQYLLRIHLCNQSSLMHSQLPDILAYFITLVLLSISCSVSIYRTFTRFIRHDWLFPHHCSCMCYNTVTQVTQPNQSLPGGVFLHDVMNYWKVWFELKRTKT